MRLTYHNYKSHQFTCSKCNWTGMGADAFLGDLSEIHTLRDVECPQCKTTLYTLDLGVNEESANTNDKTN